MNALTPPVAADTVAPLAGAWVEICGVRQAGAGEPVAPLAGAWVEIIYQ